MIEQAKPLGFLGKAGAMGSSISNIFSPISMGLQVGGMLYGAWDQAKQAKKQIKELGKKAGTIQSQMVNNATNVRENLTDIDEEFGEKQNVVGEMIGEKLEESSSILGQTINKGRGLLTGNAQIQKEDMIEDMSDYQGAQTEQLETQRGNEYSNVIDPHLQGMEQNQQSLLDIASQQKQLRNQDSFMENLF